jgi:hypothetical protein
MYRGTCSYQRGSPGSRIDNRLEMTQNGVLGGKKHHGFGDVRFSRSLASVPFQVLNRGTRPNAFIVWGALALGNDGYANNKEHIRSITRQSSNGCESGTYQEEDAASFGTTHKSPKCRSASSPPFRPWCSSEPCIRHL